MAENFTSKRDAFKCPCTRRGIVVERPEGQGTRTWTQTVEHFEPTTFCQVRVTFNDETFSFSVEKVS